MDVSVLPSHQPMYLYFRGKTTFPKLSTSFPGKTLSFGSRCPCCRGLVLLEEKELQRLPCPIMCVGPHHTNPAWPPVYANEAASSELAQTSKSAFFHQTTTRSLRRRYLQVECFNSNGDFFVHAHLYIARVSDTKLHMQQFISPSLRVSTAQNCVMPTNYHLPCSQFCEVYSPPSNATLAHPICTHGNKTHWNITNSHSMPLTQRLACRHSQHCHHSTSTNYAADFAPFAPEHLSYLYTHM